MSKPSEPTSGMGTCEIDAYTRHEPHPKHATCVNWKPFPVSKSQARRFAAQSKPESDEETFTLSEVEDAIKAFLEYGEQSFVLERCHTCCKGQHGYFSGEGWAARALRFHLKQVQAEMAQTNVELDDRDETITDLRKAFRLVVLAVKQARGYANWPKHEGPFAEYVAGEIADMADLSAAARKLAEAADAVTANAGDPIDKDAPVRLTFLSRLEKALKAFHDLEGK